MKLDDLKARGALVPAGLVEKQVEWTHVLPDGEEVTDQFSVFIVRQSYGVMARMYSGKDDQSRAAAIVSACVRFGDGSEELTYDEAFLLDAGLGFVLIRAVNEVNRAGESPAKNSPPPTNSGTTSSSVESAAEQ